MTAVDWNRLSNQRNRRPHLAAVLGKGDPSIPPPQATKTRASIQTPLVPTTPPVGPLWGATEAPQEHATLLTQWREVCGRIVAADRWFANNDESTDPQRYERNVNLYCELMAQSVELAKRMEAAGIDCKEAAIA